MACSVGAQESYIKVYDFPVLVKAKNVQIYNGRIYTIATTVCDFVECSFLAELTVNGDTLWTTLIPDIDVAPGNLVIVNDTITITGNNDPLNTAWRMSHFTLDGEKIGATIQIEHPIRKFTYMFQLTSQYFNDRYVICGSGWEEDTIWSLIYIVDKQGEIDTLIILDGYDRISACWHSYIDSEGRLTTYHWVENDDLPFNYRKIYKFDSTYDTIWTYHSENTEYNNVIPFGCELLDGRTILSYTNPEQIEDIHSIRAINTNGTKDWEHNYMVTGSRKRNIYRLKTMRNGDIIGSGSYTELADDPRIRDSPWLFRMSPEGALLWERVYYDFDSTLASHGSSRIGALYDFIELEDGDIIGVGDLWYNLKSEMLIMRVDSNGCLDPDNCNEVNIVDIQTTTKELPFAKRDFEVYPNPVTTNFNIHQLFNYGEIDYEIFDYSGNRITNGRIFPESTEINVDNFPSGIYLLFIYKNGRLLGSQKFVKMESNR